MKTPIPTENSYDYKCQLIVIGDSTVGKTSLIYQYNEQSNPLKQVSTVGVDFISKDVNIDGVIIRTKIWDTAGQERYRSITDTFYRYSNGVILVFDLNSRDTFDSLKIWIQSIKLKVTSKNVKKILIGNKTDLKREVSYEEGLDFANSFDLDYYETSAKTKTNIKECFDNLITEILKTGELENTKNPNKKKEDDKKPIKEKKVKKGCCS